MEKKIRISCKLESGLSILARRIKVHIVVGMAVELKPFKKM